MAGLSQKEHVVLELLEKRGDAYGLELVDGSEGALKRGTVYVTLGRMEEKGLVAARKDPAPDEHSGMPRRRYRMTALGARLLDAERAYRAALKPARAALPRPSRA